MSVSLINVGTPYYFKAYLTSDRFINQTTYTNVTGYTIDSNASTSVAASDFNTSTGAWSPPAGIYLVFFTIKFTVPAGTSLTASNIVRVIAVLLENSNRIRSIDIMNENNAEGADMYVKTVVFTDILFTNGSNNYGIQVWGDRTSSGQLRISGKGGTQENSFFGAYKIG